MLVSSLLVLSTHPVHAEEPLRIAVASNFAGTMERLAELHEHQHGVSSRISSGSSGKHYAQIRQGAPFDVFFSADDVRTAELAEEGHGIADTRQVYARGRLVLWSRDPDRIPEDGAAFLASADDQRLAMANPRLAPYGAAAEAVMDSLNLERPPGRVVVGQNIGKTFNFVTTGNAAIGFVALSQVRDWERENGAGSRWLPDADRYPPVIQEAIVLSDSDRTDAARELLAWMREDPDARAVIEEDGYGLPR
ncbi:MAG: molybdate ABC transporter substrate-binding protein [Pseudomonadota bacterium]